jgi:hypothetical protein
MIANTEEAMGEYVKALVRLDALDGSRLAATLQVGGAVCVWGGGGLGGGMRGGHCMRHVEQVGVC